MAKKAARSAKKKGASKQVAPRKSAAKAKAAAKPAKPPVRRPVAPSKSVVKPASTRKAAAPSKRKKAAHKIETLDLSAFPPEAVTQEEKHLCLACVLDAFLRHMGLGTKTAYAEIRKYAPSVAELTAATITRPYFIASDRTPQCPYCGSAPKWHAKLLIYRIESGKATDALRRQLVKSLKGDQFAVLEEKATQQHAFFEWLEKISEHIDLDDPRWLKDVSRHYLGRKEPKVDWQAEFQQIYAIRRSRRIESGWEVDHGRLFLAPLLFDELLLVQYLISRSHRAGGLTLEGRYTLHELFHRLRGSGYLRAIGVQAQNPSDAFEQLLAYLSGGEASLKFYYIVDRRDLLEHANAIKGHRPPVPKIPA